MKNSSSSRARKTGAQLQTTWRSAKNAEKQRKTPSPPPYAETCPSLLRTKMSNSSGDELNLRHFHCSRDPNDDLHNRDIVSSTDRARETPSWHQERPSQP